MVFALLIKSRALDIPTVYHFLAVREYGRNVDIALSCFFFKIAAFYLFCFSVQTPTSGSMRLLQLVVDDSLTRWKNLF